MLCRGGYPEIVSLDSLLRDDWYDSHIDTVTRRDLFQLADILGTAAFPALLQWAAAATATEINITAVANGLGIDRSTVVSHLEWLWTVFLIHELTLWSLNFTSRAVRQPKLHVTDTGLATNLLGVGPAMLAPATARATGALLETFTVNISRQLVASGDRIGMFHYRDHQKPEIDLVLERRDGAVVAVEVNATSSPTVGHVGRVRWLRDKLDSAAP